MTGARDAPAGTAETADPACTAVRLVRPAHGVVWSVGGTAVSSLAQWAIIVVLARYGTPSMVGQYALGLAISTPIVLLAGLALRTVQVTDSLARFTFVDYLRLRIVGMAAAFGLIGAGVLLTGSQSATVIMLVGLAKSLDGVADIFLGLFQRWEHMATVGVCTAVSALAKVAVMSVLLVVTGSIVWATTGLLLASALGGVAFCGWIARSLAWADAPAATSAARRRAVASMANLTVIAIPLGFASGIASLTANLPRYLVEHGMGAAALGTFTALAYVVPAANTIFASVAQTVLPRMARFSAHGDVARLARLTRRLVVACVLLGSGGILAAATLGRPVLSLAYGPTYAEHVHVLTALAAAAAISGVTYFIGTALSAVRRFGNQLAASTGTMLLTAAAGWVLVPRYGLPGAAWLVVVAMASEGALKGLMLRRALRERSWN